MDINVAEAKRPSSRAPVRANHLIDVATMPATENLPGAPCGGRTPSCRTIRPPAPAMPRKSAHEWMEEKPHLAALAAWPRASLLGAILSPRRKPKASPIPRRRRPRGHWPRGRRPSIPLVPPCRLARNLAVSHRCENFALNIISVPEALHVLREAGIGFLYSAGFAFTSVGVRMSLSVVRRL